MRIAATLSGDQAVELAPHVGLVGSSTPTAACRARRAGRAAARRRRLLVARERRPGALAVDAHRLGPQLLLDDGGVEAGEPERREQAERDGAAVRELVAGGRLERVRERVAEVELRRARRGRAGRAGRRPS